MKPQSAKQKGRKFQQQICKMISQITGVEYGKDLDIDSRGMGQSGVDVILRGAAKDKFPFDIECKNQELWQLHKWIEQAKANQTENRDWLLFCKRNYQEPVVVLDAKTFLEIYEIVIDKGEE